LAVKGVAASSKESLPKLARGEYVWPGLGTAVPNKLEPGVAKL
jgi:hypothetical protein